MMSLVLGAGAYGQILEFKNSDRVSGEPLGIGVDGQLQWHSNVFDKTLDAPLAELNTLLFEQGGAVNDLLENQVEILMNRGDLYRGQIKKVSEGFIHLDSTWGQAVQVSKQMVREVRFIGKQEIYLADGTRIDEWEQVTNRRPWQQDGEGISGRERTGVCRQVHTGGAYSLNFQFVASNSPRLRLLFSAGTGKNYDPESYLEFACHRDSVTLRVRNLEDVETVGQKNDLHVLEEEATHEFTIYCNLDDSTVAVVLGDDLIANWSIPEDYEAGEWLYLFCEYDGVATINNLSIKEWNKALPFDRRSTTSDLAEDETPLVYLKNGDVIGAEWTGYADESLSLDSDLGFVKISSSKVGKYDYSPTPYYEAKRELGDARIELHDGSILTMVISEWQGETIKGSSQNFGATMLHTDMVNKISFNIYD